MNNKSDSVKSNQTQYSSIYSSKSNFGGSSIHRTPSTTDLTIPIQDAQPPVCLPQPTVDRFSLFTWLFRIFREYMCKTQVRESPEGTAEAMSEFSGIKCKKIKVYVNDSIETEQEEKNTENNSTYCTKDICESKESMDKHITYLSNRYKKNKNLCKITNQIRNCMPLSSEDVDDIMHFNKNEILTIILLQNYCLEHHREHIELLTK